jgi:DNA-binding MarR family transcriptional regulator
MEKTASPTAQKLLRALMQFKRVAWHQQSTAGCTPGEFRVLFCIKRCAKSDAHEIKVSEISKLLRVTSPTVTQMLKSLEANGLIERRIDPTDRRAVGITLTKKGEMVTQKAEDTFYTTIDGLVEFLGEEQSEQLVELLSETFRYFNEKAASANDARWDGDEEI